MVSVPHHVLESRKVIFDLSASPLHWIPDDVKASHLVNGIHLLLPAGELWFCRVFNQVVPLITDETLKQDVVGFVRQEASHAQAHRHGERWLEQHGMNVGKARDRADWIFGQLLGDRPLGVVPLPTAALRQRWLVLRVGLIAAIEHFTGLIGDWCMNSQGWDKADPVVSDLFRWHLAEEVEHRSVAFDLYEHLCRTHLGFYVSRQALMAIVFPLFLYILGDTARCLGEQDSHPEARKLARMSMLRLLWHLESQGRRTDYTPTLSFIVKRVVRWVAPGFNPVAEGDTQQALDYIARSPAAQAGAKQAA
jgi:predicted metal-dependent hydrolase